MCKNTAENPKQSVKRVDTSVHSDSNRRPATREQEPSGHLPRIRQKEQGEHLPGVRSYALPPRRLFDPSSVPYCHQARLLEY